MANKNQNLSDNHVKNSILQYLHRHVNINEKHNIIKDKKDIISIRNGNYIICPRLNGTRTWIVIIKIEDTYYAVNFPKHGINKRHQLVMHSIEIGFAPKMYCGTIMEGIFFKIEECKYLIVDEVYYFCGDNQLLKTKDDRLNFLKTQLPIYTMRNDSYIMEVSQYYRPNKIDLANLYQNIKNNPSITEIVFYPGDYHGTIYSYTIIDSDIVDDVIKMSTFILANTEMTDKYHLFNIKTRKKIGLAFIPNISTSKMVKSWFRDSKKKELYVQCKMNNIKNKWIPFKLVDEIE